MAFAASDTHSFAHGMVKYLSAEYAHYSAAKRRKPVDPKRGVPMGVMIDAVREDGQPPEEVWPYLSAIPSPLSAWVPPRNSAPIFRHPMVMRPTDVSSIYSALDAGQRERTALKIMLQLLVEQKDRLKLGDIVPVGDLFDAVAEGDEAFSDVMRVHFENAKKLYQQRLRPILERDHGMSFEQAALLPQDDPRLLALRNDDRLVKTLLLLRTEHGRVNSCLM
jgi:hypothetical protein